MNVAGRVTRRARSAVALDNCLLARCSDANINVAHSRRMDAFWRSGVAALQWRGTWRTHRGRTITLHTNAAG